ncbi:hypothetical protein F5B19DRAFT_5143 [Rostrohypoxylon terebratum]|nr:hypothetical protein F5B19DRAFT_5143 [Rostrohypoxylon terebratum]
MDRLKPTTRWALHFGLQISFFAFLAACFPVTRRQNTTIVLPENVSNHGSPDLICTPASWTDVALFYLGNYVAHAATVRVSPGEPISDRIVNSIAVLLFPQAGVMKGLNAIFRCAVLEKSPLQRAARSGALCMLVRTPEWRPMPGESIQGLSYMGLEKAKEAKNNYPLSVSFNGKPDAELNDLRQLEEPVATSVWMPPWLDQCSKIYWMYSDTLYTFPPQRMLEVYPWVPWGREVHGTCKLPKGYTLAFVPRHAEVRPAKPLSSGQGNELIERFEGTISASFSIIKAVVAILQTLYASFTLYRTRGDQLDQYGYAAFGLTVTPYLVMSIINLTGNLVTPEYASLYMVRSDIMEEARKRGAVIDGEVGEIVPDNHSAWNHGIPNDFSGSFVSMEGGRIGLTNVKYSSSDAVVRQLSNTESTNKIEPTDTADTADTADEITPPTQSQLHIGDEKKATGIGADGNPITDSDAPIELRMRGVGALQSDEEPKPQPILLIPSCGNFKRTRPAENDFAPGISEISKLPLHQRSRIKYGGIIGIGVMHFINLLITGIIIAIIGGISGFQKGGSTTAQRVWTMMWIAFGFLVGPNIVALPSLKTLLTVFGFDKEERQNLDPQASRHYFIAAFLSLVCIYGIPGFGGYVVVGKMLYQYGNCVSID